MTTWRCRKSLTISADGVLTDGMTTPTMSGAREVPEVRPACLRLLGAVTRLARQAKLVAAPLEPIQVVTRPRRDLRRFRMGAIGWSALKVLPLDLVHDLASRETPARAFENELDRLVKELDRHG